VNSIRKFEKSCRRAAHSRQTSKFQLEKLNLIHRGSYRAIVEEAKRRFSQEERISRVQGTIAWREKVL